MANEYTGDDNQEDERTQAVFPLDDQMDIPPLNMPVLHDGSTFDAEPSGLAGLVQETQAKRQADAASAQTQESQETQAFDPLAELDDEVAPEPQPAAPATSSFAPQRPAADDVATVAFAAVAMNPADDAALGKGVSAAKTKNPKRGMIIAFSIIGALLVLELLGYSATRIFAALGIGGVAVAFACKDAVENLISGFIIVFNKPFRVGDFIAVGELSGTVEDIAVRSTTLRALDGSRYVLPNTALTNQSIINYADMEKRLIDQTFTLHYKHSRTDLERFEQDLRALLQADPAVVQDDIRTDFVNYGAHGMDVQVYYYVIAPTVVELGQIKNRLNLQIKELLDNEGFELAYNSATVYLEQETEGKDQ